MRKKPEPVEQGDDALGQIEGAGVKLPVLATHSGYANDTVPAEESAAEHGELQHGSGPAVRLEECRFGACQFPDQFFGVVVKCFNGFARFVPELAS